MCRQTCFTPEKRFEDMDALKGQQMSPVNGLIKDVTIVSAGG